jgi:spore germination cell wall hydrolase CwlJ-like protein
MEEQKQTYYCIIIKLISIIILLCIIIAIIPKEAETIEIIKEVEKEIIVEVEKGSTYAYNIASAEREMLARLVYREANTESLECQMAVASTVINRWQDGRWGDTIEEVIYSPYQFTPANLLYQTTPTELNYTAVDLVLQNGCTLEPYVMYFRADHHFDWEGYNPYTQIDYTCFGYFVADKNS